MQTDNLIIDGTNLEYRIFFIANKHKPVDRDIKSYFIEKYLYSIKNLINLFTPTNIYITWDKKLLWPSTNFRKELLNDTYKIKRIKNDDTFKMFDCEKSLLSILSALGIKHIFPNRMEADDVIAWLSHKCSGLSTIVSTDQDLLQLIKSNTSVYNLREVMNTEKFIEKYKILPTEFVLYKAILGDASDNISGLKGFGKVRAKSLAQNFKTENISNEYNLIIQRNIKLMDLSLGYTHYKDEVEVYENQFNTPIDLNMEQFKILCNSYKLEKISIKDWESIVYKKRGRSLLSLFCEEKHPKC